MFQNREEAGLLLAERLVKYKDQKDAIVLSIPRGGVVVGKKLAEFLNLPLSIVVVKKLGTPNNPELAIGALAPDGVKYLDWDLALRIGVEQEYLDRVIKEKKKEIEERMKKFQIPNDKLQINFKLVILTDDGVATGSTIMAAIKYIRHQALGTRHQVKVILAVPVIAKDTFDKLKSEVDEIVALEVSEAFSAVGQFYEEFPQLSDEEVIKLL